MAHYLVRAEPIPGRIDELRGRLDAEEFRELEPFGRALTRSLENARWDPASGEAVWEEEDYCSPPLAMERDAVLDDYFRDLEVERVEEGEGWERVDELPGLWSSGVEDLRETT